MKLYVADRETGTFMEEVATIDEGIEVIKRFENDDRNNDCFEKGFYEVVDEEHHTVYSDYYGIDERTKITVKSLRDITGLSAQKFGDKYGIPMRTIQNWEGGQRECPAYVLSLLERVVWEDYEEENGHVPEYSIESTDYNATYDLHLDDSDDLEDAKKKAKYWEGKGYPVELVRTKEFLTGFYNKIKF